MTLGQARGALDAVAALDRERLQHALLIARAAQAPKDDYQQIMRGLS